jgi:hypothetical protein
MPTRDDLLHLAAVDDDPAVSMYLPWHAAFPDCRKNDIRLRNLLRDAEALLAERGFDADAALAALRGAVNPEMPLHDPEAGPGTEREFSGLAIFATATDVHKLP